MYNSLLHEQGLIFLHWNKVILDKDYVVMDLVCARLFFIFAKFSKGNVVTLEKSSKIGRKYQKLENYGSVALLWRNAKRNVNPGLSYFEQCSLACLRILANLHLRLHFAICQSITQISRNLLITVSQFVYLNHHCYYLENVWRWRWPCRFFGKVDQTCNCLPLGWQFLGENDELRFVISCRPKRANLCGPNKGTKCLV